ncbi:MAG: hypothetical protein KKB51_14295 [Candidatus Riflebacteria bacterium]|nr:hypothetical protein [Candidatus Riflebacteria bacterium]
MKEINNKVLINKSAVALLLLLLQLAATTLPAATRVFLSSRLEFTPALLDMLRRTLMQKLEAHGTIILQPVDDNRIIGKEASGSFILQEHGMDKSLIPENYVEANTHLDLVWVLAANLRVPDLPITGTLSGEQFATLLQGLKKQSPDSFPWFESLSSRVTLRNFDILFAEVASSSIHATNSPTLTFWRRRDSIAFLYRAIEEHFLNPFSLEADLGLAMDVFAAADSMFVSHWVPAEYIDDERLCRQNMGKVRLLPFPAFDNKRYLRIRLCLYVPAAAGFTPADNDCHSADERFIDLDYPADIEWIEKKSNDKYDALIMGDL